MKEADIKACILYDSNYIEFWKVKLIYSDKKTDQCLLGARYKVRGGLLGARNLLGKMEISYL